MDAQQYTFNLIRKKAVQLYDEGNVFDTFLPSKNTPYPFVYLGEVSETDNAIKNAIIGDLSVTLHFWSNNPRKRGQLSQMIYRFKCAMINLNDEHLELDYISNEILPDNSTNEPLLHGILELKFKYS